MTNRERSMAVLLTCHNRRETTLTCLRNIKAQEKIDKISTKIFLVDDGSSDGTEEAVSEKYPDVHILKGDGSLYWTGGMYQAMKAAMEKRFDFYLWLNDDTKLYPFALNQIMSVYDYKRKKENERGIVVGSLCDPETGQWTYGASVKSSWWHPLRFKPIIPKDKVEEADNFWGNFVLIPKQIADKVGNLDSTLMHGQGDHDYALRVKEAGFKIFVSPDFLGECSRNSVKNTWKDSNLSLKERYQHIFSIKAMPLKNRFYYLRKHGGWLYPFIFISPYIKLLYDHFINLVFKK